jgi:DNA-binding GntR family transcriptional regulator
MRNDILMGVLEPGSPLRAQALAERYQVSSVPVREALQQLHGEGVVVIERNKGARVRKLDLETIGRICDVMEAMESYFSRRFAEIASPFQIETANHIEDQHEAAVLANDIATISSGNKAFHAYISRACNNPVAETVWDRHRIMLGPLRRIVGFGEMRRNALSGEHREIIAAASRGDRDRAGRVAELHARSSRDDLLERLRNAGYR